MSTDLSFKVAKRRDKPITFDLEGDERVYAFTPPKQASMVLPMLEAEDDMEATRLAFAWLDSGLSKADREHISKRLKDKKDDLDMPTIEEIVTALFEKASGNPTT